MAKVTYLGPLRALPWTGPSGQRYLFFGPGPSTERPQPLQVTDKDDLAALRQLGGFHVEEKEK